MYSIDKNIDNIIVLKKSKFITKLYKISSVEEINNILNNIKSEYQDATHICYGYILNEMEKCFDDGEPSKTAGIPILNVLKKNNLSNVLAIVIRYFGGIKLGAGGLLRAYSNSVIEALKKTNIVELIEGYLVELEFKHDQIKLVDYLLIGKEIINKNYDNNVTYSFYLSKDELNFVSELEKIAIHLSLKDKVLISKS